jgi:hypothetical protein
MESSTVTLTLVSEQPVSCRIRAWNCCLLLLLYLTKLSGYKAILKRKGDEIESKLTSPLFEIQLLSFLFNHDPPDASLFFPPSGFNLLRVYL